MKRRRRTRPRTTTPDSITLPRAWRRYGVRVLAALIVCLALVCVRSTATRWQTPIAPWPGSSTDGANAKARADWARYHDRSFRVTRVVDGDTLDIDVPDGEKPVTRIRLWGVDTPEIAHGGQPDMYFGREAAAFAKETLAGRDVQVVLWPGDTRGKYGRLLAYVFLERGGAMFNEMLIEQGYAYADLRFDHPYKQRFEDIEKQARRARSGLWAGVTPDRMPAWRQRFARTKTRDGG